MSVERQDVSFLSDSQHCGAWLYLPAGEGAHPGVILGSGLGAERRFRLDAYSERFAQAGFAALAFDYRHFGDSEGEPRQLVAVRRQLADWRAAVAFARQHPAVDRRRLALWGTSLAGGHVQRIAAADRDVAAVIAQVPFIDGRAAARAVGTRQGLRLALAGDRDLVRAALRRERYRLRIFGPPGSLAAMTNPGAEEKIRAMMPPGEWEETMPARILALLIYYRPGRQAAEIRCPILYQIAEHDSVNPPDVALAAARRAPQAEVRRYAADHFDIYLGEHFEQAVSDQVDFLQRHLGGKADQEPRLETQQA